MSLQSTHRFLDYSDLPKKTTICFFILWFAFFSTALLEEGGGVIGTDKGVLGRRTWHAGEFVSSSRCDKWVAVFDSSVQETFGNTFYELLADGHWGLHVGTLIADIVGDCRYFTEETIKERLRPMKQMRYYMCEDC